MSNHNRMVGIFMVMTLVTFVPSESHAYIGPGLGAGTIGVILGVIGSVFLAIFAIFWYPIKRLFKRVKTKLGAKKAESTKPEVTHN